MKSYMWQCHLQKLDSLLNFGFESLQDCIIFRHEPSKECGHNKLYNSLQNSLRHHYAHAFKPPSPLRCQMQERFIAMSPAHTKAWRWPSQLAVCVKFYLTVS